MPKSKGSTDAEFTKFMKAAGKYAKSIGWNMVVAGPVRIQHLSGNYMSVNDPKFRWELVIEFTGAFVGGKEIGKQGKD